MIQFEYYPAAFIHKAEVTIVESFEGLWFVYDRETIHPVTVLPRNWIVADGGTTGLTRLS